MRDSDLQGRITRVADGGDHDVQLVQLQTVMQRIQMALHDIPTAERIYVSNALLNLAVNWILGEEGVQRTATLLMRLSDAVHRYPVPSESSQAIGLGALHG